MTGPSYAHPDDDRPGATSPAEPYGGTEGYPPAGEHHRDEPPARTAAPEKVPSRTRVSGIWVASIAAVVVLLLLLIFILQNGARVQINIFGANPTLPLGVALLLAAVLGALLVALVGIARVVQLRHTARRFARKAR